jgi:hypothetical protein
MSIYDITYHVCGRPNPKWHRRVKAKTGAAALKAFKKLKPKCVCHVEHVGPAISSRRFGIDPYIHEV